MNHRFAAAILSTLILFLAPLNAALALDNTQILLITNKNVPDSRRLADIYAQLRNIPPDHLVELDLPIGEEMPFDDYEWKVVAPLRQYLTDHNLKSQITCLLTFYGVPFRVASRINSDADKAELDAIMRRRTDLQNTALQIVANLEQQATALDPAFKPGTAETVDGIMNRAIAAAETISKQSQQLGNPQMATQQMGQVLQSFEQLGGPAELDARLGEKLRNAPGTSDADRAKWNDLHDHVIADFQTLRRLQGERWDPDARAKLRDIASTTFGPVGGMRIIDAQTAYLGTTELTGAATDNELSLLWWDYYPRAGPLANALNLHFAGHTPPVLMTMRLDAPTPDIVEKMMRTSIAVEQTGLQGAFAVDARGLPPVDAQGKPDGYGQFDEHLRHLALIIRTKTNLKLAFDDTDMVFPPHFVKNTADYAGWYSVNNYIPGCDYNPGAVGYHIASFEMVTLHGPSTGWVHGLLTDGCVATLGAVAEPRLGAFPLPDEFFPLLLTGKLPLAEVYWKTNPMTSWMISCIGDPLYTPYKADPAIKVEDLPAPLQAVFQSQPTTQP
jgi:uncharacterized protein (TIGR03790 family)